MIAALAWEARLQVRYKIVASAIVVTAVWVAVLWPLRGHATMDLLLPAVLFTDIAVFGLFFLPGLMFIERAEGVAEALAVTPYSPGAFLATKVAVLTGLGIAIASAVATLVHAPASWPLLIIGVVLTSVINLLAGFTLAVRFRGIGDYLVPSGMLVMVLQIPLLGLFGLWNSPLLALSPSYGALVVLHAAFAPVDPGQLALGLVHALGASALLAWAAGRVRGQIVERGGVIAGHARRDSLPGPHVEHGPARSLLAADARMIVRDPVVSFLLFYPAVIIVAVRILVPRAAERFADVIALEQFYPLLASLAGLLFIPSLLGSAAGFMLLDERDERTLLAVLVTPLSRVRYLAYRGIGPMAVAFVFSLIAIPAMGLAPISPLAVASLALVGALAAPLFAFFIASVASNKVEGLALVKATGFVGLVPIVAYLFPEPGQWLFGVLPLYWPAKAYWLAAAGDLRWPVVAVIGAVINVAAVRMLAQRFAGRALIN